ncbi:recombinase family protein [Vibrio parahaemolyticus]|uniref:recombinase family protein n=1 Tax=Vibrio parahaemolyticus TaxID=670 RepID=UPI003D8189D6
MASYAYFFGDDQSNLEEFKVAVLARTPEENIFIEDQNDDETRPKLDMLAQSMVDGDTLLIPSLKHIGTTMNDVVLSLESFSMLNITLNIDDTEDSKLIESMGGLNKAASVIKGVFSLQQRVVRERRKEGIRKAIAADAKLHPWEADKKKYRGKVGNSERIKLRVKGLRMRGHTPTEISKLVGVSRGSVYNYIREMDQKHPCAIAAYQYLLGIEGFRILPSTTYKSVVEIVIDVISYLATDSQKAVRESVANFTSNHPEITEISQLKDWLTTNDIEDFISLSGSKISSTLKSYCTSLVNELVNESMDDTRSLLANLSTNESSHLRFFIRTLPDFGEKGLERLTGLVDNSRQFKEQGIDLLIQQSGLEDHPDARLLKMDTSMQSLISPGLHDSWELTICHFVD